MFRFERGVGEVSGSYGSGGGGLLVFKGNGDGISRRCRSLKVGPKKID